MFEEFKKRKILWLVVFFATFNILVYVFSQVIVDAVADRVIEKLEREYSPSPYGPGIDPDKVNFDFLKMSLPEKNEDKEERGN